MKIIGLTGSIGSGKTTVAGMFADLGVPVFCSDKEVHQLMAPGGAAVDRVAKLFPQAVVAGKIDRKKLGKIVFTDKEKLAQLENILHPLVQKAEADFIKHWQRRRKKAVVMDIPLLFETNADERMDMVVVVWAPHKIQKQRVMAREGMTEEKFTAILASQIPVAEKKNRADIIIPTGLGMKRSRDIVKKIVRELCAK